MAGGTDLLTCAETLRAWSDQEQLVARAFQLYQAWLANQGGDIAAARDEIRAKLLEQLLVFRNEHEPPAGPHIVTRLSLAFDFGLSSFGTFEVMSSADGCESTSVHIDWDLFSECAARLRPENLYQHPEDVYRSVEEIDRRSAERTEKGRGDAEDAHGFAY